MAILLIVVLVCAILLGLLGSLPAWASIILSLASLAALAAYTFFNKRDRNRLNQRRQFLAASWGTPVRHLSGMPLPQNSQGNLFLMPDQLLMETEQDHLTVRLADIEKIILARADQIRKIPDKKLCSLLNAGTCRSFSAVREMIRHRDSLLHQSAVLLIVTRHAEAEPDLLIFAVRQSVAKTESLLRHPHLKGKHVGQLIIGSA
jgi:hypothetical protein